jgi:hypothetical protein
MDDPNPKAEEPKEGAIFSLEEVAVKLHNKISENDLKGAQVILNSFEENDTASDLINYLSTEDFNSLIKLQEKANEKKGTITTNEIDEYVSLSDKIAIGLLCAGRVLDKGLTGICDAMSSAAQMTESVTKKFKKEGENIVNDALNSTQSMIENTVNTYEHTRWFLRTVITKQSEVTPIIQHIKDNYGHLLFTYDGKNQTFEYDDSLTGIVMADAVSLSRGKSTNVFDDFISHPSLNERSSTVPTDFKPIDNLKIDQLEKFDKQLKKVVSKSNRLFKPRSVILRELKQSIIEEKERKGTKRNFASVEGNPHPNPNKKVRPNTGGKTRRKIRRNKKAKTKKRKANKKTKKRKMKTKTKKTKRKTNKRRTKK